MSAPPVEYRAICGGSGATPFTTTGAAGADVGGSSTSRSLRHAIQGNAGGACRRAHIPGTDRLAHVTVRDKIIVRLMALLSLPVTVRHYGICDVKRSQVETLSTSTSGWIAPCIQSPCNSRTVVLMLPQLSPHHLADVAWAVASCGYYDLQFLEALAGGALSARRAGTVAGPMGRSIGRAVPEGNHSGNDSHIQQIRRIPLRN